MRNLHVISHTHWDREWYLPFQIFRLKLVHLVDGLLELLEKDKQFKYFMLDGQTIILDDFLNMRPEKEALLGYFIRRGRIIIGPWHILPDMFLVGPESHIRNLLQGDHTASKFGHKMMIGYMPDSFGHIGQTPQILRGFDMRVACVWRGVKDEPAEFWWQAPDGSKVLMVNLREGYGNGADLPANNPELFSRMISERGDILAPESAVSDLLIMYGTDHMEPPTNTSEAISYANRKYRGVHVIHSTLPMYVTEVQNAMKQKKIELHTIKGELRACKRAHLLPGVLSTRMWIKQQNTYSENLLTKWVEPFTTWQEIITGEINSTGLINQKTEIIRRMWCLLMENHPHDSICGCSIDQVHDEMKIRFDQVNQIGEELSRQSLESLASDVQTSSPNSQTAIVVFNPIAGPRTDAIEVRLELPNNMEGFDLLDENGIPLAYQQKGLGNHDIVNVTFDAKGLQSALSNVYDGRALGMTIQDIQIRRNNAEVSIDAILASSGEPNLKTWNSSRKLLEDYFADSNITTYHIRARSTIFTEIIAVPPDVPGHGYRTFWLRSKPEQEEKAFRVTPLLRLLLPLGRLPFIQRLTTRRSSSRPPYRIENEFLAVEAMKDGTLSLFDKRTGSYFTGLHRIQDGGDCGDEYNFAPPGSDRITTARLRRAYLNRGSVQQTLELDLELKIPVALAADRKSRSKKVVALSIKSILQLNKGVPRLDINTSIDNQARDHRLRVHFPAPFAAGSGFHDGHYEIVEREIGVPAYDDTWMEQPRPEVPQRAFTSVTDGKISLAIANRGLPEVEVLKNKSGNAEIAVTLLRCVGWLSRDDFSTRKGHAGPFLETPGAQMPGRWSFDYSIIPHAADMQSGIEQAYSFEVPMRGVSTGVHAGSLPIRDSFLSVDPPEFVISATKQSENGRGWLVRGYNNTNKPIAVRMKPWKLFKNVELVNLAEQKITTLKPDKNGYVNLPARGHEILTVLFVG